MSGPEIIIIEGQRDRPLIVFVNGMGMDINIWEDPSATKVLGGAYPLKSLLKGIDTDMRTSFMDLRDLGCPVLLWNQTRPAGPIEIAANELREHINEHRKYAGKGIVLIAHSRGGLVARKYLETGNELIRGVITLASPNHGTTMAKWAAYIAPVASLLGEMLKDIRKEDVNPALRKVLRFLSGKGIRELLPGSDFFAHLKDRKHEGTRYVSIGGTDPDLVRIGGVSLSGLVSKAIPGRMLPKELKDGYGDGMVSAASSVLPYADEHYNFHVNHASILFDREVRALIIKVVESL
jgi:pimeloyl-ACP methyl ester carboxylesterase